MIHSLRLQPQPFEQIKIGLKKVEMRLNDEKRSAINIGDTICFTNIANGETLFTRVVNKLTFRNFFELYERFNKQELGYEPNQTANPDDMKEYYDESEINRYGTVALIIELINNQIDG